VSPSCCPTCRLLAFDNAPRCLHCGTFTVAPAQLVRPVLSGVTAIIKKPHTGWRDFLALMGTSVGMFAGAGAGALLFGPPGLLAGLAIGFFGYTKQFWRTALKRKDRIVGIAPPRPPPGDRLLGIARPHERTLDADALLQTLVVASTILLDGSVLARSIESVPFWLTLADKRRILVDGPLWLASAKPVRSDDTDTRNAIVSAGIPLLRSQRRRCTLVRTILRAGDPLSAVGSVAPEQLVGGGYRDHLVDAMRGHPGAPLWLERLDPNMVAPD
jgi:hypothetical protein